MNENRFDEVLREMREEPLAPAQLGAAEERVLAKLMAAASGDVCGGFRAQFDDYRAGRLTDSRRLLMEDHLGRCAACRKALEEIGAPKVVEMPVKPRRAAPKWMPWAVAAGLGLVGAWLGGDRIDAALAPSGSRATVASVNGTLFTLAGAALEKGAPIGEAETVRTGPGGRAILTLSDGTVVELNERTELKVQARWSGDSIHLNRGDIIVQAAKQKRGRLKVYSRDSVASVKGTIFSVSAGTSGSVVGVVEGAVEVQQPSKKALVTGGGHMASARALESTTVRETVAWSQDKEKYYALLAEFAEIKKQIDALPGPAMRTQARLLPLLPANPMMYAAIPNLGETAKQTVAIIEQRAQESAVLREWWQSSQATEMKKFAEHVQKIAPMLGDELVFVMTGATKNRDVLFMAEVKNGQAAALDAAIKAVVPKPGLYRIAGNLLTIAGSPEDLTALSGQLGQGAGTPFAAEIARRYQRGVQWIFALDAASAAGTVNMASKNSSMGIERMKYLVLEQRSVNGHDENEASLSFDGGRTGLASWIGSAGANGSAEYISGEATFAFSASTKNPRQMFDEITGMMGKGSADFQKQMDEVEAKTGVKLGDDLFSSLGSGFTIAMETPRIPVPGMVMALEVYRPATMNDAMRRYVEAFNKSLKGDEAQKFRLTMTESPESGRPYYEIRSAALPVSLTWTYDQGYLVASNERALVTRALATRGSGGALVRSSRFLDRIPATAGVHQSGFLWVNAQGAVADAAQLLPDPRIKQLLAGGEPLLVTMNGETERIHVASRTRLTNLLFDGLFAHGSGTH